MDAEISKQKVFAPPSLGTGTSRWVQRYTTTFGWISNRLHFTMYWDKPIWNSHITCALCGIVEIALMSLFACWGQNLWWLNFFTANLKIILFWFYLEVYSLLNSSAFIFLKCFNFDTHKEMQAVQCNKSCTYNPHLDIHHRLENCVLLKAYLLCVHRSQTINQSFLIITTHNTNNINHGVLHGS